MPRKNKPPSDFPQEEPTSPETPAALSEPPAGDGEWRLYRGTGHLTDPPDDRDFPISGVWSVDGSGWKIRPVGGLAPRGTTTPSVHNLPTAKIRDQSFTSMCVAFTYARHINARLARLSGRVPDACIMPSEKAIYGVAKRNEPMDQNGNWLEDAGCYMREAALGMMLHGVVKEERLMFDEAKVNEGLPADVLHAGWDAKIAKFHRVPPPEIRPSEDFHDELERLLFSGYTVPYAQAVDRAFNDYRGGAPIGKISGATRGNHATLLTGYDRERRVYFGDNSWGTGWGQAGRYEITYDRVAQGFDFTVLTVIPDPRNIR